MDSLENDLNSVLNYYVKRDDMLFAPATRSDNTSAAISKTRINKKSIKQFPERVKRLLSKSSKSTVAPQQQQHESILISTATQHTTVDFSDGSIDNHKDNNHVHSLVDDLESITNIKSSVPVSNTATRKLIPHFLRSIFISKSQTTKQSDVFNRTSAVTSGFVAILKGVNSKAQVEKSLVKDCTAINTSIDLSGTGRPITVVPELKNDKFEKFPKCDCEMRRLNLVADTLNLLLLKNNNKNKGLRNQKVKELQQIDPMTCHFITCSAALEMTQTADNVRRGRSQVSDKQLEENILGTQLPLKAQVENEDDFPKCDCKVRRLNLVADTLNFLVSKNNNKNKDLRNQKVKQLQQIDPVTGHFITCSAAVLEMTQQAGIEWRGRSQESDKQLEESVLGTQMELKAQVENEDDFPKCECKVRRLNLVADTLNLLVSKNNKNNKNLRNQKVKELQQIDPVTGHFITCSAAALEMSQPAANVWRGRSQESDKQLEESVLGTQLPLKAQIESKDDFPKCDCEMRRLQLMADTLNLLVSKNNNKNKDLRNQKIKELQQIDPVTCHFINCSAAALVMTQQSANVWRGQSQESDKQLEENILGTQLPLKAQVESEDDVPCDCKSRRIRLSVDSMKLLAFKSKNKTLINQKIKEFQNIDFRTCHFKSCPSSAAIINQVESLEILVSLIEQLENEEELIIPPTTINYFPKATCYDQFEAGLIKVIGSECTPKNVARFYFLMRRISIKIRHPTDENNKTMEDILSHAKRFYLQYYHPNIKGMFQSLANFLLSGLENNDVD